MNNDIFIEITLVFLKKTVEAMEPWLLKNPLTFLDTLINGVKTMFYVFCFTDVNNKTNSDIVDILEQCIVHFVQFMKQITEEENLFLQLNSKDASLFVYKKMLFQNKLIAHTSKSQPTRVVYDKMMLFFSCLYESNFMIHGKLNNEIWWKRDFINHWSTHMKI